MVQQKCKEEGNGVALSCLRFFSPFYGIWNNVCRERELIVWGGRGAISLIITDQWTRTVTQSRRMKKIQRKVSYDMKNSFLFEIRYTVDFSKIIISQIAAAVSQVNLS
jgi:hypothetical protein